MDNDEATPSNDEADRDSFDGESWLAEQARLVLLEDGS
jgi:hypothetical protein